METTATNVTMHREFDLGIIVYKVDEYPDLRGFYNKVETKDQEPVILKIGTQGAVGQ